MNYQFIPLDSYFCEENSPTQLVKTQLGVTGCYRRQGTDNDLLLSRPFLRLTRCPKIPLPVDWCDVRCQKTDNRGQKSAFCIVNLPSVLCIMAFETVNFNSLVKSRIGERHCLFRKKGFDTGGVKNSKLFEELATSSWNLAVGVEPPERRHRSEPI